MATKLNNFDNGAFIVSRSIFNSDIWFKPPEYLKIWFYLFGKANHKPRNIKGYTCERGQYFCDYKELSEQLEYKIGYRKKKFNESFMKNLMKYLRDSLMISTMKKPRGLLITICNYSIYQDLKCYEKTNEKTNEKTTTKPHVNQTPLSINKNVKNEENDKNKDLKPPIVPPEEIKIKKDKVKEIYDLWNQYAVNGITPCKSLTKSRIDKIKTRLKENPEISYWMEIFSKLQKIPFYCGDNNRGWVVTLDYVMHNDTNHVKVAERRIDQGRHIKKEDSIARELREMRERGEL
jgi:hypothetical protein